MVTIKFELRICEVGNHRGHDYNRITSLLLVSHLVGWNNWQTRQFDKVDSVNFFWLRESLAPRGSLVMLETNEFLDMEKE